MYGRKPSHHSSTKAGVGVDELQALEPGIHVYL